MILAILGVTLPIVTLRHSGGTLTASHVNEITAGLQWVGDRPTMTIDPLLEQQLLFTNEKDITKMIDMVLVASVASAASLRKRTTTAMIRELEEAQ